MLSIITLHNTINKMNKILNITILITLILLLSRCDGNYIDVKITGLVSDKISGKPITNAEITVNCWVYNTEIWESKALEKSALTDSYGKFNLNFKKGEALDIVVIAENYDVYKKSVTLKKSNNNFDIKLSKK